MKDEIAELEQLIKSKLSSTEQTTLISYTSGSIICALAKYLIKATGYGVASTVLSRELRTIGKRDAEKIMKIFGIDKKTPENASKVLKILAFMLGLKYEIKEGRSYIKDCPYGACVKEFDEPFICNVCLEYNKGIVECILDQGFTLVRSKWRIGGDDFCKFDIRKR
jgi:predicted hydrocarbon binding protein